MHHENSHDWKLCTVFSFVWDKSWIKDFYEKFPLGTKEC